MLRAAQNEVLTSRKRRHESVNGRHLTRLIVVVHLLVFPNIVGLERNSGGTSTLFVVPDILDRLGTRGVVIDGRRLVPFRRSAIFGKCKRSSLKIVPHHVISGVFTHDDAVQHGVISVKVHDQISNIVRILVFYDIRFYTKVL